MARDRLLKNTFIYFIGTMATRLMNLFMMPLYTRTIPMDGMGYYTFVLSMLSVVMPALLFMIWDVYLRFSLDCADEESKQCVTTNVILTTGVLMVVYLAVFLFIGTIFKIEYLWPIALLAFAWPLAYIWQSGMRSAGENKTYALSGTVATLINILVSLLFILVLKEYVLSQYISQAAALLTIFVIAEPRIKLFSKVRLNNFDWGLLRKMLKFGAPLIINTVAYWLISGVSSFVIKAQLGDTANGIFSAASRFSMVIATVTQIIYLAWQEEAFREAKNENLHGYISKVLGLYNSVLLAGVCFGLPILKIVFPLLIKGDYTIAWIYVPAVIMTAVYSAISSFSATAYSAKMKTGIIMNTTIIGGAVSFLLSWFGIRYFGMQVVAVAGAVGFMVTFLLRIFYSKRTVQIKVNWLSFIALNLAVCAVIFVYYIDNAYLQWSMSAAGLAFFLVLNRKIVTMLINKIQKLIRKIIDGSLPPSGL